MRENEEPLPDYSSDWDNQEPTPLIGRKYSASAFDFSEDEENAETIKAPIDSEDIVRDPEIESSVNSSESVSTSEDTITDTSPDESIGDEETDDTEIIYTKERPFLKFLKWTGIALFTAFALLFIVGFFIGLSGSRTPSFDGQIIYDQWSNLTGDERFENDTIDELSKNKP